MGMGIGAFKILTVVAVVVVACSVVGAEAFNVPIWSGNSGNAATDTPAVDEPTQTDIPPETPVIPIDTPTDVPADTPADTPTDVPTVVPDEPAAVPDEPTVIPDEPAVVPDEPAVVPDVPAVVPDDPPAPVFVPVDISGMTEITGVTVIDVSGSYYIDGREIISESGPAIDITADEVLIVIKGNVTITSTITDAIRVSSTTDLTIQGYDMDSTLVATAGYGKIGNTTKGGSGIGNAFGGNTGDITITGLYGLSAYGAWQNGFGIGGYNSTVTINDTHIIEVVGGSDVGSWEVYNQVLDEFGKSGTGGPGIGGVDISITDSTIDLAVGGPKAAAIGAIYHTITSIRIVDSTIGNAYGGSASAGIGGSRQENGNGGTQTVTIYIENSNVTATGGEYGAGIGAGYDTYCQTVQGECNIVICNNSVINAQGGKYAAGIGTAYHMANLTGSIDATVDISNVHCGQQKNSYSVAQDIGYGVIDANRDGKQVIDNGVTFTVAGTVIDEPTWY